MRKILLYPFSILYGIITSFRNFLYDSKILKQHEFDIPVISVGNLTVGGTGKTPHAEHLISLLKKDFKIAFLSRGYKRKTKGFILANKNSGVDEIGDEPVQIKQKFPDITVAVCEKRVIGINKIINNDSLDIEAIILDDAFQHRSVRPNINILLIDYTQQIFNDSLLPAGRLRESTRAKYRANFIIYTKCPPQLKPIDQRIIKKKLDIRPYQNLFFTSIVYGEITPAEKGRILFSNDMRKHTVLLITGIGNPKPLLSYIESQVGEIIHLQYDDHYRYKKNDIDKIESQYNAIDSSYKMILTTEKDLVRLKSTPDLPDGFMGKLYYIPIEIRFLERMKNAFNQKIINYVRENRSNSKLYKRNNKL